nr:MAG TPA: hypothetical protein [Caudoviricetes sp.]
MTRQNEPRLIARWDGVRRTKKRKTSDATSVHARNLSTSDCLDEFQ